MFKYRKKSSFFYIFLKIEWLNSIFYDTISKIYAYVPNKLSMTYLTIVVL